MRGPYVVLARRVACHLARPRRGSRRSRRVVARRRATRATRRVARAGGHVAFARALESTALAGEPPEPGRHRGRFATRSATSASRASSTWLLSRARPREEPTSLTHALSAPARVARCSWASTTPPSAPRACARARTTSDGRTTSFPRADSTTLRIQGPSTTDTTEANPQTKHHAPSDGSSATPARETHLLPLLRSSHPPARRETNARNNADIRTSPDANADVARFATGGRPDDRLSSSKVEPRRGGARAVRRRRRQSHTRGDLRAALIDPLPRGVSPSLTVPRAARRRRPSSRSRRGTPATISGRVRVVETADGPAEVGRTIVVATRANATTVETMETARRVAEGVSMFASIDDEKSPTPSSRRTESKRRRKAGGEGG